MTKELMVGYLESWGEITFTQAARKGYDAIVMAFGTIDGSKVGIYNGAFAPYPDPVLLKKDIANALTVGAEQILFSVGGENNTYNPKDAPVKEVAQNIVGFLKEYGFTGIDFDLEIDASEDYLDQLCAAIKEIDSSIIITAAPQLNQASHQENLFLVSTGVTQLYNKAVANKRFDYLFIQAYNNAWPQVNGMGQKDVGFISQAFINLKNCIPSETMITIGEPASINGAGETSVYHGPNAGADIYHLMADQYKSIAKDPQFGGAMVWSINLDAKKGDQFVNTIKPAIEVNPAKMTG